MGGFRPYWLGVVLFATLSIMFSLGNIENSKGLQIVSVVLRFVSIFLMMLGSIITIFRFGAASPKELTWFNFSEISGLFGNTIFIFIVHHSVSGIMYPVRPQKKVHQMFFSSFSLGAFFLLIEGVLAAFAFGHSEYKDDLNEYPCSIQKLYNENFLKVPFIGQFTNFYPMLNVSAVPVLVITLRYNIF